MDPLDIAAVAMADQVRALMHDLVSAAREHKAQDCDFPTRNMCPGIGVLRAIDGLGPGRSRAMLALALVELAQQPATTEERP